MNTDRNSDTTPPQTPNPQSGNRLTGEELQTTSQPERPNKEADDRTEDTTPDMTSGVTGASLPASTEASTNTGTPEEETEENTAENKVTPDNMVTESQPPPPPQTTNKEVRPPLPDTTPAGRHAFTFTPDDIPDEHEPQGLARHLIGGKAWVMPYEGALELTWAIQDHQTRYVPTIQRAFDIFEAAANIKFIRIDSANFNDAHLKFDYGNVSSGTSALPLNRGVGVSFKHTHDINLHLHEIGHALGLAHPFDERNKWPGNDDYYRSPLTVMSYNQDDLPNARLGDADVEALQFLYGAPGTNWQSPERFFNRDQARRGDFIIADAEKHIIEIAENIPTDMPIYDAQAHNEIWTAIHFSLPTGERDNDLFRVDEDGLVYFKQSPDYENPHDVSGGAKFGYNNFYEIAGVAHLEPGQFFSLYRFKILIEIEDLPENPVEII